MIVLVVNAGSSYLKYQLFDTEKNYAVLAKGLCDCIGLKEGGKIVHKVGEKKYETEVSIPNHSFAVELVVKALTNKDYGVIRSMDEIEAVGHRIVHGGPYFSESVLVTEQVLKNLEKCRPLAPLHTGAHIQGIEGITAVLKGVPQVLVIDTGFHCSMSEVAKTYALPKDIAEDLAIRRYGAHGTSHEFISSVVPSVIGKPAEGLKQIVLHIGNGASASAEISGKPVETSMGLTPLEGLVMGGRTGDIDPAVVFHLIRNAHMSVDELDTLFNKRSGMMGLTGFGDLREVHRLVEEGNEDAKLALDIYVHRIVGYIGNYTAQMGGVDVITFTAGVGENDDVVRKMVCDKLAPFGVKLDEEKNATRSKEPRIISTPDSSVTICVIPTNEELAIARKSAAIAEAGEDYYGAKVA